MSNRLVAVERKSMDKQRDTWHRRLPGIQRVISSTKRSCGVGSVLA